MAKQGSPRSSRMVCHASSSGNGWLLDCRDLRAFALSSPMRSPRCASVWPHCSQGLSREAGGRKSGREGCWEGSSGGCLAGWKQRVLKQVLKRF